MKMHHTNKVLRTGLYGLKSLQLLSAMAWLHNSRLPSGAFSPEMADDYNGNSGLFIGDSVHSWNSEYIDSVKNLDVDDTYFFRDETGEVCLKYFHEPMYMSDLRTHYDWFLACIILKDKCTYKFRWGLPGLPWLQIREEGIARSDCDLLKSQAMTSKLLSAACGGVSRFNYYDREVVFTKKDLLDFNEVLCKRAPENEAPLDPMKQLAVKAALVKQAKYQDKIDKLSKSYEDAQQKLLRERRAVMRKMRKEFEARMSKEAEKEKKDLESLEEKYSEAVTKAIEKMSGEANTVIAG